MLIDYQMYKLCIFFFKFFFEGNFSKVVNSLRNFLNDPVFITLHKNVMTLSMVYPLLVMHWVQFIGLLDYDDIEFWKSLLNMKSTESQ